MTSWPGVAMTSVGDNTYRIEVPASAQYIIFNNGSAQTDDLTLQGMNKIYNNGTWSDYGVVNPTTPTPTTPSGSYTVQFTNSLSWSGTISCYYWSDSNTTMTSWPGVAMTSQGTNDYGQTVYSCTVPSDATYIIFNNGSSQTVDIPFDGSALNFYAESTTTNGKYNYGTW